jgi:hypothetical protein
MTTKKQFEEICAFLTINKAKKVNTIFEELVALMSVKQGGSDRGKTFLKDSEGNTYAVYCYYHKKWELINTAAYGTKTSAATGLNTMCKEGVSSWSKQQRLYKKRNEELLQLVAKGELSAEDLPNLMAEAEELRKGVELRGDEHGFENVEEVTKFLESTVS